jgi:hypothetical protein
MQFASGYVRGKPGLDPIEVIRLIITCLIERAWQFDPCVYPADSSSKAAAEGS